MNIVIHESDVMLHLMGGVECDVLMTACGDVFSEFRSRRRAKKELTRLSVSLTMGPDSVPEQLL